MTFENANVGLHTRGFAVNEREKINSSHILTAKTSHQRHGWIIIINTEFITTQIGALHGNPTIFCELRKMGSLNYEPHR